MERAFSYGESRAKADARVSDVMHLGSSITPAMSMGMNWKKEDRVGIIG
ncbi:MAG: hypothetical protein IPI30_22315 [Saprospiraceae bacterium]|nr:hypothetical protein [Candidatus Vicinibacter affinis]